MSNPDETHFLVNIHNRKTLGLVCDEQVKYAYFKSCRAGMTHLERLSGWKDARMQPPLLIFKKMPQITPPQVYRTLFLEFLTEQVQTYGWIKVSLVNF